MIRILSSRVALAGVAQMSPDWFTFFSNWVRQYNRRQVSASAVKYELTGSTDETAAATFAVSAGNMGSWKLTVNTSCTSNANVKTVIIKAGSTTIQTVTLDASTAAQSFSMQVIGRSAGNQYLSVTNQVNCAGTPAALTLDMSPSITITVSLQLGTITDTIALESWALDVESA